MENGTDGIPGEAYKATRKWASRPIARIMNKIKEGAAIPGKWTDGAIVYIYKTNGDPIDCGNYRPVLLTQIICKIWPGRIARKPTNITHILNRRNKLGYKEGISSIDVIIKIE